jgi:hypothetical protein
MKALRGQDFGDKETLCLTYKSLIKPVMIFNGPIWYPRVEPNASSIKRLQRVKNAAMRLITGAHKLSSQNHHLAETKLLPVADHLAVNSLQVHIEKSILPTAPSSCLQASAVGEKVLFIPSSQGLITLFSHI